MNRFSSSIAKILDYKRLGKYLEKEMLKGNIFIDLGSGDCSLIGVVNKEHGIDAVGVEIDEEKVALGQERGFKVFHGDIRNLTFPGSLSSNSATLHAGFCLFNIFRFSEVMAMLNSYLNHSWVREIFFEIQNAHYFENNYPAGKKYSRPIGDMLIESYGEPFFIEDEKGVDLIMNYYSGKELINSTKDRLFTHFYEDVIEKVNNLQGVEVATYQWPVRFNAEEESSHYYIRLRKK